MGYIHTLPFTFWAAIVTLTIASTLLWRVPREHTVLLTLQLCLFVAMFWFTPLFLGRTVTGTRYSFGYHDLTEYILHHGHLDPTSNWYHNWPTFNLMETVWLNIGGIANPDAFVIFASISTQIAVVLCLRIFFRSTLGLGNYWAAAACFFILFNWTAQTYYSPQALGIILLLTFLFLLSKGEFVGNNARASFRLVGILVMVGLTMTHLLTALTGLFIVIAFEIVWLVRRRIFPTLTFVFLAFILGWQIFYAGLFLNKTLPNFLSQVMDFELMWFRNVTRAQKGSEGHLVVVNIRLWLTMAAGAVAMGGLALSRRFRAVEDKTMLGMGGGILIMLPFQFYGNEFLSRLFIFILPVLAYFAAKLLRTKVTALILACSLLVALPFGIIGLHGNGMADDVTPNQLAYWHFLEDKTYRGNLGLGGMTMTVNFGKAGPYIVGFNWVEAYGSKWPERMAIRGWIVPGMPNYLAFGGYEDAGFKLWTDFPQGVKRLAAQANGMSDLILCYQDGEVASYYHDGVLLPYYPPFAMTTLPSDKR